MSSPGSVSSRHTRDDAVATGTQIEVVMPQMGVSVSEGTVTKWLKQPGDAVALDEALLEISTDKVDTEVPSPGAGVVTEILVAEGETVEVGTVLAVLAAGERRCGRSCRAARADAGHSRRPISSDPGRHTAAGLGQRAHVRLAGRRPHRRRARGRPERDHRHRHRGPRHEERHPRVHRIRASRSARAACRSRTDDSASAQRPLP